MMDVLNVCFSSIGGELCAKTAYVCFAAFSLYSLDISVSKEWKQRCSHLKQVVKSVSDM